MNLREFIGHGGGKIKCKSIMAILLLSAIILPFSAGTAFATTNITNGTSNQNSTTSHNLTNVTNITKTTTTTTTTKTTTATNTTSTVKAAGSPASVSFTSKQINTAATSITNFVQTNQRLPNYVTIANTEVTMPQFLQLITANLLNINKGLTTPITIKTVVTPTNSTETVKSGNILKSEYLNIAQSIETSIASTVKAPSYVNSSLGKINFNNLVYTFSKLLNFQNTNNRLPSYVSVEPWSKVIANTVSSEGSAALRPVYICSDNINNIQTDTARIDDLISALAKLGIKAYDMGLGPDTHDSVLSDSSVPSNAVIVEIYGGADAGVIAEKSSTWYKDILGKRTDFVVYTPTATNINGLAWLPRAHDDNYDPASFTGIANPAQYLLDNGIQYYYGLTTSTMTQCAESIYNVDV
jgi:hypothetical protein